MEETLSFFSHEIDFTLDKEDSVSDWILFVVSAYGKQAGEINYIFCDEEYMLTLNRQFLDHDYYTDILTFPHAPEGSPALYADIYISIDRVRENADTFQSSFTDELHRVIIHGILHLLGFDDHDENEAQMRAKENEALSWRKF
ncbi:MAG: rRNA maturation RNase YbeY [Bacteroidetes bacterium]|nr:MAG: rRNA maturation RNase YbeY [Bacteroidota bacterium]